LRVVIFQDPICLFPRYLDRVAVPATGLRLSNQIREIELSYVAAGVPLAEKVSSRPYGLDHVQREGFTAGVHAACFVLNDAIDFLIQD
jgi:hypothetical protein